MDRREENRKRKELKKMERLLMKDAADRELRNKSENL